MISDTLQALLNEATAEAPARPITLQILAWEDGTVAIKAFHSIPADADRSRYIRTGRGEGLDAAAWAFRDAPWEDPLKRGTHVPGTLDDFSLLAKRGHSASWEALREEMETMKEIAKLQRLVDGYKT